MSRMRGGRSMRMVGTWILVAISLVAGDAAATVTLTASRSDTLYTTDDQFDCGDLARRMDADLPWNVVRLRAEDDSGQATSFSWKLPKPNVGYLLPDDPTIDSSAGGAFAVQSFCAQIGSGCILTKDTLKAYRRPTILYAAPTCADALPGNTKSQFDGDFVTIRVKADGQKGKPSKSTVDVGYGRLGTPTLWISDLGGTPDDGIGKKQVITDLVPTFSVTLDPSIVPPVPIKDYVFDNGAGREAAVISCLSGGAAEGAAACARIQYEGIGPFNPLVEVRLEDGSAYCDSGTCRAATCVAKSDLIVQRSPKQQTYRSRDVADIVVTWRNKSPRQNGCTFFLRDLRCTTTVKKGAFEEQETVRFEPARCEADPLISCAIDADCGPSGPCLSSSHCSETTDEPCAGNADCSRRECPRCQAEETCIRVLQVPDSLRPGQNVELIRDTVELRSVLPGKTKVTETWTVQELFDRANDTTIDRFKIRGQPVE